MSNQTLLVVDCCVRGAAHSRTYRLYQRFLQALEGRYEIQTVTLAEEDLRPYLVKKAYSTLYGARNLRRTIQRDLEDPISEKIIDSFEKPISAIRTRVENEQICLETDTSF